MPDALDPNTLTSATFNRKTFVGLGAGAVAAVSSSGAALGQNPAGFGQPHPPIVAADDPTIGTEQVALARPDTTLDAYAAWPAGVAADTPGIVMVHAIWGVDATIRDVVRRYAKAGYVCIVPIFSPARIRRPETADRHQRVSPRGCLAPRRRRDGRFARGTRGGSPRKQRKRRSASPVSAWAAGLRSNNSSEPRTISPRRSFTATSAPVRARGAPTTADTFAYAAKITAAVRGNYGARDTSIDPGDVRTLFGLLTPPHELSIYDDAGHAFFDDTRPSYVATAAGDAWNKTLAWFHRYLT